MRLIRNRTTLIAVLILAIIATAAPAAASAASGQLYAFGYNRFGQLGSTTNNLTDNANPTPTQVSLPGAGGSTSQVAAGANHSLAVTSTGQLYSFGYNSYGQLGNTNNSGTGNPNPAPTQVSLPGASGTVTQIAAGGSHSLALTSTGQLYAFGYNRFGELGISTNSGTFTPNPTPTAVSLPGASGPVTQIAAGSVYSLALTSTGQLYAFGNNHYGQLGTTTNNGNDNANPTPTRVPFPGGSGAITRIAAGGDFSLVLTSTGRLYAFGDNFYGQLGNTTNNGTINANPTPTPVTLPGATGQVAQVAAGDSHSLALTSSGQLYAFGYNSAGQLGNTTNNGNVNPNPIPTRVTLPGATGAISQITAGYGHSLAATSTSQVYAFGLNNEGQLGNPTATGTGHPNPTPTLVPIPVPAGMAINTISYGPEALHTLVALSAPPAAPALSRLRVSPHKFSVTGRKVKGRCAKPTRKNHKHKHCTRKIKLKITYTLNTAASVKFTLKRQTKGRRVKGRCVTPTRRNRKHKHCKLLKSVRGSITHQSTTGPNNFTFNGKLAGHKLKPGSYQLIATPTGGKPQTTSFTITS